MCARRGRDKLTLVASPAIADLGAWLEQLLAESTGKDGRGVIPIDREPLGAPDVYGDDRLFVYVRLGVEPGRQRRTQRSTRSRRPGHPVVRIGLDDLYDIGGEFFRWEFATAVAGSVIGINPFDQPDVEASKVVTRELTAGTSRRAAADEKPIATFDGVSLYADERNAAELSSAAREDTLEGMLQAHLGRIGRGDYAALLAYVEMTREHERALTEIRRDDQGSHARGHLRRLRPALPALDRPGVQGRARTRASSSRSPATTPATCPVPGRKYTFGVVKAAQARGDFQVLAERGRRALRIHIGADVDAGLGAIRTSRRAGAALSQQEEGESCSLE